MHEPPPVIVVAESDAGLVTQVSGVEGRSHFVQRNPLPGELHIGGVGLLRNSRDTDELSLSGRNGQR